MNELSEINRHLDRWLFRYRLQRAARWALGGLLAGLAAALLVELVYAPGLRLTLLRFLLLALGLALGSLSLAGLGGWLWPIQRQRAVRSFDRRFGLQERASTAVELAGTPESESPLLALQRQDALAHVRLVDLKAGLPWRIPRAVVASVLALLLIVAGLTVRDQPYFLAALQKQNLIKQIQEQATRLEELQSNLQKLENLTSEQRRALEKPVAEAARRLENAQSLEEALSALDQAEQELQALAPAELQNQAAALQQAGQAIHAQSNSALESFGEQLAQGNYAQAAQELGTIDPQSLSAAQRDELAGDLQSAASTLAPSNPGLAQSLQEAASALQAGDPAGAQQALGQAAQNLGDQASDLASANAAGQTAAQLDASQQNLAQTGSGELAQLDGNGAQGNAGSQASAGQNGGQGTGNNSGNNGLGDNSGSGAGQGQSQGSENSGSQAGAQPIDTANQPGDGGERPYESIYAPQRLGGEPGPDVQLPGSGQPGETIGQTGQAPGTPNQGLTPYSEVYASYENVIRQAIESGQVPQHLQALVRDYFSSLAP